MQRLVARRLLVVLLLLGSLAACGPWSGRKDMASPEANLALTLSATVTNSPTVKPPRTSSPSPQPAQATKPSPAASPTLKPTSTVVSSQRTTASSTPPATQTLAPTSAASGPASPTPAPPQPPLVTPSAGRPLDMSLGWRFGAAGHLTDGVILYQGDQPLLVVTQLGQSVHALGAGGEIVWEAKLQGPAYAAALHADRLVAIGDDAGAITLLDEEGRRLWRHDMGSRITVLKEGGPGALLAGGWQAGSAHGGHMTLLSTELDGKRERWHVRLESPVSDIVVLPGSSGTSSPGRWLAVGATLDGEVRAVDQDGSEVWRLDAGAPVTGLALLENSQPTTILAGLQDGRLLALDAGGDGAQRSKQQTPVLQWQQTLGEGGPVWHTADLVGDLEPEIIVGTGGKAPLLALLSGKGEVVWRVTTASPVGAVVVVDLDRDGSLEILAGMASGEIQAYDEQGRLRGSIHAGLPVWGLKADGGGHLWALADVVAWQIKGIPGPTGGPWLPPPGMVSVPASPAPEAMGQSAPGRGQGGGATLVFLGDVAPGRSMEAQLARYGSGAPWVGLAPLLKEADLAVANLECVLATQGQPLDKRYLIRAHPLWGQTLIEAGIDLVTVANNHALDYGQVGLDETLATLQELAIVAIGARTSEDSGRTHSPALFNLNGVRVAVLAYAAARWNGSVDVPATDRVAWADLDVVGADVRRVRDQADVVVVLLHAGTEYADEPSPDQVAVARAAVDAGADLVVGHHPHVTQTVEQYQQGLIVYSLGDAFFDIPRPAAMRGHLLRVHVTGEGLTAAELWPFWIEDAFSPRPLDDGGGTPRVRVIYP